MVIVVAPVTQQTPAATSHGPRQDGRHGRGGVEESCDGQGNGVSSAMPAESLEEAVPVLTYGQGNNWVYFKEAMIAVTVKYCDLGTIVMDETYYAPPMIDTSLFDATKDPPGLVLH